MMCNADTLMDSEADVLKGGVVTALDSSQDLHDVLHFGALDLQTRTSYCSRMNTQPSLVRSTAIQYNTSAVTSTFTKCRMHSLC